MSDVRMPQLDGLGLFREIERRHPRLCRRVLFITGEWLAPDVDRRLAATGAPTLRKPFDLDQFRVTVRQLLER